MKKFLSTIKVYEYQEILPNTKANEYKEIKILTYKMHERQIMRYIKKGKKHKFKKGVKLGVQFAECECTKRLYNCKIERESDQ